MAISDLFLEGNHGGRVREWLASSRSEPNEGKFAGQGGITRFLHALYTPDTGPPKATARLKAFYDTNRWLESRSRRILRAILGPKR
jgi:hypothetical protein